VRVSDALIPTFRLAVLGVLVSATLASAQTTTPIIRLISLGDGPDDIAADATTGASLTTGGLATVAFQVTGTYTGEIQLQCTVDGTNYAALTLVPSNSATTATSVTSTGIWFASVGGCTNVRARSVAAWTGTATTSIVGVSTGGGGGAGGGGAAGTVAISQASTDNDVDVASSALPSGAATSAKQDTQTTHLATLAGGITSAKYQVDCITGCSGGTSDTDDASVAAGQTTGVTIPMTHVYSGAAWVRLTFGQATMANSLPVTIASNQGAVPVSQSGLFTVDTITTMPALTTGSAVIGQLSAITTSVTPGTAAANLGKAEDAVPGATDTGVMVLAVRKDTAAVSSTTDGDYSTLSVDGSGLLRVNTMGASQSASVYNTVRFTDGSSYVTPAEDGTHDATVKATGPQIMGESKDFDGSALPNNVSAEGESVRPGCSLYGVCYVMLTTEDGSASPIVAHDAVDSNATVGVGATVETLLSGITLAVDGDRTRLYAGADGVLITRPHSNLEDTVQERTTNTDGASTAFASGLAAPGANVYLRIVSCTFNNSSTTGVSVDLRDGAAGSVLWTFPVPSNGASNVGGATHTWAVPLKLSANTALAFDSSAAVTTLTISCNGFRSKL
jgi:hypothetical protein